MSAESLVLVLDNPALQVSKKCCEVGMSYLLDTGCFNQALLQSPNWTSSIKNHLLV